MINEELALRQKLDNFKQQHRELDSEISLMQKDAYHDSLKMQRLKKKKLYIKTMISQIEGELYPEIVA